MPYTKLLALTALAAAIASLLIAMSGSITVAASAKRNCQDIEKLNTRVRQNSKERYKNEVREANESVKNLDENAKLLGITVTPELRERVTREAERDKRQALSDKRRTLTQYAAKQCPFLLWP